MLWNILAEGASEGATGTANPTNNWLFPVIVIVLVILLVVWFYISGRKNKQRQKDYIEQLAAIAPGHKVKTIGGICGVVVEVCDDNTVIIETGTEASGKSVLKIDKECIAQTDAKGPTQIARENAEAKKKAEKEAKNENHAPETVIAHEEKQEAPVEEKPQDNE